MYLVDTNVISELRKRSAHRNSQVADWVRSVPIAELYLSAITIDEIEVGIRRISRRDEVQGQRFRKWFEHGVLRQFRGKILSLDSAIAIRAAGLHVPNPMTLADLFIAATAIEHNLVVVTRNTQDFVDIGVGVINPFTFED